MNKPVIIITGGTGLIGSHLTRLLLENQYQVKWLSRRDIQVDEIEVIQWDPAGDKMPDIQLDQPTIIVNLAGDNLALGRWTQSKKKLILSSRLNSLKSLHHLVSHNPKQVIKLISTSAIGYYGTYTSDHIFTEEDGPGTDFLAQTCIEWEEAIQEFEKIPVQLAWIRAGVVLSDMGGALKTMIQAMGTGFAIKLGSGKQWVPWIHIEDLCNFFLKLIEEPSLTGVFNGVSPQEINNEQLTRLLAKKHKKILLPFGFPAFLLKLSLGELASISLEGSRVSARKLIESGFRFSFPTIDSAISSFVYLKGR